MSTGPSHETSPGQLIPFSVECARAPDGPLVAVIVGDLDIATAEILIDSVISGAAADPRSGVVLDFTAVDFIDSTGLRAILEIVRRLDEGGGGLVLLNPASSVGKLLSLAGLDERIPVAMSLEEAEAVLGAGGNAA